MRTNQSHNPPQILGLSVIKSLTGLTSIVSIETPYRTTFRENHRSLVIPKHDTFSERLPNEIQQSDTE